MNTLKKELDFTTIRKKLAPRKDNIIDGKKVAKFVRQNVKKHVEELRLLGKETTLAVVLVGDDDASQTYVNAKIKSCQKTGIRSLHKHLPANTTQEELNACLDALNDDPNVDGILLQMPLPKHLNHVAATDRIDPAKDVDGFHPLNLGFLMARRSKLEACTPRGVMILLNSYEVDLQGVNACVLGRSVMVGRPMAQMLTRANATVTVCHRFTKNLAEIVGRSDVVVSATGVPGLVKGTWIKEGAVVVDIGINYVDGKMVGDVEFSEAKKRASLITPVPGGVGPMTVAALMSNTALAAWDHYSKTMQLFQG